MYSTSLYNAEQYSTMFDYSRGAQALVYESECVTCIT